MIAHEASPFNPEVHIEPCNALTESGVTEPESPLVVSPEFSRNFIFLTFLVVFGGVFSGGLVVELQYPCSSRAQTMLEMRTNWAGSDSTVFTHLVNAASQLPTPSR